jgi:uncharacterized DUF497 family protein
MKTRNVKERGLGFERVADMDRTHALSVEDTRTAYGERRFRMFRRIDNQLHVAVITFRGDRVRGSPCEAPLNASTLASATI